VLLTFDDARGSLWSVGAPLLRQHGMRGVVFAVPGRISTRSGGRLPTLDDVAGSPTLLPKVLEREQKDGAFLFWDEVEWLSREGVFEFQSHTHSHLRIHSAPRLEGFVTPSMRHGYRSFDLPVQWDGDGDLLGEAIPLGSPILGSAPRLSEAVRVFENPEARRACAEEVAAHGEAFFTQPRWQARLARVVRRIPHTTGTESRDARVASMRREIGDARKLIEEHTGRPVKQICYPWHATSALAKHLVAETGHLAAYCGKVADRPITRPGDDALQIARIGEDWLEALPGQGRLGPMEILRRKAKRRLGDGA
jgi:peptidoglycan/xylan/chitin deacetylase (PgdA/CDA1 family)